MNHLASTKALHLPAAALVLAATCLFGLQPAAHAQTPAQTPAPSTAAPGTAPMTTAAPGTKPAATAAAAVALSENAIARYDNRWDAYLGLAFMNGQAGQNLPKRYDMGGADLMVTYYLNGFWKVPVNRLGITANYRIGAGTTPVNPEATTFGFNRILAYQNIFAGGLSYRGPKNRYVGINFHALAGATHGTFDTAITNYPVTPTTPRIPTTGYVGVYSNRTSPWGAAGGSIDFNYSPHVAIRMQPDLVFEHFGTETREFFGLSAGIMYRFGHLQASN